LTNLLLTFVIVSVPYINSYYMCSKIRFWVFNTTVTIFYVHHSGQVIGGGDPMLRKGQLWS